MDTSNQNIIHLQGIGPQKTKVLKEEINVSSWLDMLYFFPYRYTDRSTINKISEIDDNMLTVQLKGRIIRYEYLGEGKSRRLSAIFDDNTGVVELVWFKAIEWIPNKYKMKTEYVLFGKPRFNKQIVSKQIVSIIHPELEIESKFSEKWQGIQGVYRTTAKMKKALLDSSVINQIIKQILENTKEPLWETLPEGIIDKYQLISLDEAIRNIHFPKSNDLLQQAQYRLKFEELFYLQLSILSIAKHRETHIDGFRCKEIGENFYFLKDHLPFELTYAQKRVGNEIWQDMSSGKQMNRLLQGDVGSGKTLIALFSILIATDNGVQGTIMAPTEVLAMQHYETINRLMKGSAVKVALLTGSTNNKLREEMLPKVKSGDIQILIGTHSLIEDNVEFKKLGLVVVDEQHRFGVTQRAKLWSKNATPPHVLVMTATPIPRTLAMTIYGDLDVSIIDELPPGRQPVNTYHRHNEQRDKIYEYVRKELQKGKQVYIVYPLIDYNEKIDLTNLQDGFQAVSKVFPEYNICMVHGQMKPEEKKQEMQKFISGETQIMTSTTVIEVGIDVKNASVMIIENAERFGLSQLHQLRGRVGRGTNESVCILMTQHELLKKEQKRLEIMTKTNDGFTIAEEDLKLRGHGNLSGIKQSGFYSNLKIANLSEDVHILTRVRDLVNKILNWDPSLENPRCNLLKKQLDKWSDKYQTKWLEIS